MLTCQMRQVGLPLFGKNSSELTKEQKMNWWMVLRVFLGILVVGGFIYGCIGLSLVIKDIREKPTDTNPNN